MDSPPPAQDVIPHRPVRTLGLAACIALVMGNMIGSGVFLLPANLATIVEEQNWHDTWAHAVGLSYKLNPQWTLRTGVAIDQSPTNNVDRSPRVPSTSRRTDSGTGVPSWSTQGAGTGSP